MNISVKREFGSIIVSPHKENPSKDDIIRELLSKNAQLEKDNVFAMKIIGLFIKRHGSIVYREQELEEMSVPKFKFEENISGEPILIVINERN